MKLIYFVVWLSTGVFIGWFGSRMAQLEHERTKVSIPCED